MVNELKLDRGVKIWGILASIFVVIGVIVNVYSYLPTWLIYVTGLFIGIVLFWLLYDSICIFIKNRINQHRHNQFARKYFNEFKDFVDKFAEFMDQSRTDNISCVLKELSARVETLRNRLPLLPTDKLHDILYYFQKRLGRFDGTKEDFILLANEFNIIVNFYNELYVNKPIQTVKEIGYGKEELPNNVKENFKEYRENYVFFLRRYMDFGKIVNKQFEEKIFREYFEIPKEI